MAGRSTNSPAQVKGPKRAGYISQCVIALRKLSSVLTALALFYLFVYHRFLGNPKSNATEY